LNGLALCAGVGGLELGIERVFDGYQTVAFVEGEAFAASNLVKKMEEGSLAPAPIWSDLRTFDGIPWRGKVDVLSAGFPCQPFSIAGKREGVEDSRHLWPSVSRIIGEVRPSIIVLENVPGVIDAAGLGIAGNLSQMGYDFAWGIVRASEAGAPHRRARFFGVGLISDTHGEIESNEPFHARQRRFIQEPLSKTNNTGWKKPGRTFSNDEEHKTSECGGWWKVEPGVGRVVDGVADWMDRLRACGNGVVPHQADLAIRILLNTLIERRV
jgi:DNA-cytosine methyltransferase